MNELEKIAEKIALDSEIDPNAKFDSCNYAYWNIPNFN